MDPRDSRWRPLRRQDFRSDPIPAFSVRRSPCFSSARTKTGSGLPATPAEVTAASSCSNTQPCSSPTQIPSLGDAPQCSCRNVSNSTSRTKAIRLPLTLGRQGGSSRVLRSNWLPPQERWSRQHLRSLHGCRVLLPRNAYIGRQSKGSYSAAVTSTHRRTTTTSQSSAEASEPRACRSDGICKWNELNQRPEYLTCRPLHALTLFNRRS